MRSRGLLLLAAVGAAGALIAGCGGDDNGTAGSTDGGAKAAGAIAIDGSSTLGPYVTVAAEDFRNDGNSTQVTVGISGTGGGFERFCKGETDISNASRQIKDEEKAACTKAGIEYAELEVANDGISLVVNNDNDWATCLTTEQLKKIWEPNSKVDNWNQVDPTFPNQPMKLFGAGTDSGTFDFFTKAINGEEGASRTDYQPTEDDNVTVQGVTGEKGGLGYFGLSYYEENKDKLKDVQVDGGSGCVGPSTQTVQDGTYKPLSRPLYVYVKKESFARPEVKAFLDYILENEETIAQEALFVPLTPTQLDEAKKALAALEA
jgi:phosphate transport system substrate-binding protein